MVGFGKPTYLWKGIVHFVQNPDVGGGKNRGFRGARGGKYILYEMEQAFGSGLLDLGRSACRPKGETGKDGG